LPGIDTRVVIGRCPTDLEGSPAAAFAQASALNIWLEKAFV